MSGEFALQETLNDAPTTTNDQTMYRRYNIKSHRCLRNLDETLWLNLSQVGTMTVSEFAINASVLLKLPH